MNDEGYAGFCCHPVPGDRWSFEQFKALIAYGFERIMSDLKFIPETPPYMRVYGKWTVVCPASVSDEDVQNFVKWTSGNDSINARILNGEFADYSYDISLERGIRKRFRCDATACASRRQSAVSLVMRQIPDKIPSVEDVGVEPVILDNSFPEQGIILVTGPPGTGKSTLLAALMGYARQQMRELSLDTYEDPIEFDYSILRHPDGCPLGPLTQMEMGKHIRTFEDIPTNAARRSPDMVLVGESRDRASFRGLVQLADMGMRTYSTLHTRSVAETPSRILDTFSEGERYEVKASLMHGLRFVVQQRLLPTPEGKRVAVREWLRFSEGFRMELSDLPLTRLIPRIHDEVRKNGHPLIEDVRAKWKKGLITAEAYARMESEYREQTEALAGEG